MTLGDTQQQIQEHRKVKSKLPYTTMHRIPAAQDHTEPPPLSINDIYILYV